MRNGAAGGAEMTTRPCPICQQPHTRSVDCHGTPIDWPAMGAIANEVVV